MLGELELALIPARAVGISRSTMRTSYYLAIAAVLAAAGGVVYAWPTKAPPVHQLVALVPAKPVAEVPSLPPIVTDPNELPFLPVSTDLPKVPPPPMPALPLAPAPKLPVVPPPGIPLLPAPPTPLTPPSPLPVVPAPTVLPQPTPFVPPAPPAIGSVVLLQDGKMVEGTVTQTGDKVIVRRGSIDQSFAKDQVQHIGKTKEDAYRFLLGKLKADDAAGRFKLARWSMYNGLREQALVEAKEVVKLQSNHTAAAEMARTLEESIRLFNADGTSKTPPPEVPNPDSPKLPKAVDAEPEIVAEAAIAFAPRVQPVLTNLCADCHAKPGYTGSFKMACGTAHDVDPAIARHNLKAAMQQIKKDDPGASPLLNKALAAHGGMKQPAFAGRGAPAYRVLEAWVFIAAGSAAAPPPAPALPAVPPPDVKPALPPVPPPEVKSVLPPVPPPAAPKFGEDAKPTLPAVPNPESSGDVADEFDPSVYNRTVPAKAPGLPAIPPLPRK